VQRQGTPGVLSDVPPRHRGGPRVPHRLPEGPPPAPPGRHPPRPAPCLARARPAQPTPRPARRRPRRTGTASRRAPAGSGSRTRGTNRSWARAFEPWTSGQPNASSPTRSRPSVGRPGPAGGGRRRAAPRERRRRARRASSSRACPRPWGRGPASPTGPRGLQPGAGARASAGGREAARRGEMLVGRGRARLPQHPFNPARRGTCASGTRRPRPYTSPTARCSPCGGRPHGKGRPGRPGRRGRGRWRRRWEQRSRGPSR